MCEQIVCTVNMVWAQTHSFIFPKLYIVEQKRSVHTITWWYVEGVTMSIPPYTTNFAPIRSIRNKYLFVHVVLAFLYCCILQHHFSHLICTAVSYCILWKSFYILANGGHFEVFFSDMVWHYFVIITIYHYPEHHALEVLKGFSI